LVDKKEGILSPKAPFDFDKSLTFISGFPPSKEEQFIKSRSLTKATIIDNQIVVFHLVSTGDVESPQIHYKLYSDILISKEFEAKVINRITFFLSLNDELDLFYRQSKDDSSFYPIAKKLYGYHQVKFLTPFENACWAILSQRTPVQVARSMKFQLARAFGKSIRVNKMTYTAFPEPQHILNSSENEVQNLLKNTRKTKYILSAAKAFATISDEFLIHSDYEKVNQWLQQINGIGEWSASFIMLRGIGRMERLPTGEKMLKKEINSLYGDSNVTEISNVYKDMVGYWAHYLRAASLFK
jgi:DNA-3-methyladenine glycosylase II